MPASEGPSTSREKRDGHNKITKSFPNQAIVLIKHRLRLDDQIVAQAGFREASSLIVNKLFIYARPSKEDALTDH